MIIQSIVRVAILVALITLAFISDHKVKKIRNKLTISATITGLLINFILSGWKGLLVAMSGFLLGFMIMLLLYLFRGVGAGDVKLFGAIGAIMGSRAVFNIWVYSILCAGIIGVILLLLRREMFSRLRRIFSTFLSMILTRSLNPIRQFSEGETIRIPFMYAVLPGTILAFILPLNFLP